MKNFIKKISYVILLISTTSLFTSCDEEVPETTAPIIINTAGVFVMNEGSFGSGNSSISYLNVINNLMTNNLFESVNGFPLGDVGQSMTIHKGKGYLVVNNSQKIEVVNETDFSSIATINGFQSPRHMVGVGNKGYVCDWVSNAVVIVDLNSNTVTGSIPVGNGPEKAVVAGTKLFVINVGGFGTDSTVSVIDLNTDQVINTLNVGVNPNSIAVDPSGKLWILCGGSTGPDYIGGTADDTRGSLWKINSFNYDVEKQLNMGQFDHPVKMQLNKNNNDLFYLLGNDGYSGKVIRMNTVQAQLTTVPFVNKVFYGLGIDVNTGIIYGGYVPGFSQNGYVFRYNAAAGFIDSLEAGIAPNGFVFKSL